jgi:hypothetical protein
MLFTTERGAGMVRHRARNAHMSNQEIRTGFNQMIAAAKAAGDHDAVMRKATN